MTATTPAGVLHTTPAWYSHHSTTVPGRTAYRSISCHSSSAVFTSDPSPSGCCRPDDVLQLLRWLVGRRCDRAADCSGKVGAEIAAIDRYRGSGDHAGSVRCQEQSRADDVVRADQAAERHAAQQGVTYQPPVGAGLAHPLAH